MARSRSPRRKSRRRSPRKASRSRRRSCPRGHILRKGYTRKAYVRADGTRVKAVRVKAECIKGRGAHPSRKGPKVIPKLRKGELKEFGYFASEPVSKRHRALTKAVGAYGATSVFRKLNAVMVLTKNTSPSSSAKFRADRNWVRDKYMGGGGRSPKRSSRRRRRSGRKSRRSPKKSSRRRRRSGRKSRRSRRRR